MTTPEHQGPLAQRVIAQLRDEGIAPYPRAYFTLRNAGFWTLGAVAIILGALAFAAALFELANTDWRYYAATHPDFLSFFLSVAPFLWVVAIALFSYLGYQNIRHTKRGYRYPLAYLVLGAIMTSVVLGAALYAVGAGEIIEEGVGDHPPFYRPVLLQERTWWQQPEQGLLAGVVTTVATSSGSFVLKDFSGRLWTIDLRDLRGPDLAALGAGGVVRIVGVPTTASSSTFHACFVLPGGSLADTEHHEPGFLFSFSLLSERISGVERSDICKGIRPYGSLRALSGE